MSDTPRTDEAWDAVSRTPDGRYATDVPLRKYAFVMYGHSKQLERELAEVRERLAKAMNDYETAVLREHRMQEQRDTLVGAAQAVVDRWDAPTWKELEPTAKLISALRKAIAAVKGGSND